MKEERTEEIELSKETIEDLVNLAIEVLLDNYERNKI